jgi:hypothetical protein
MREFIEIVTESIGLANRKSGEKFVDPEGNEITFMQVDFYPPEGGTYPDEATTQQVIDTIQTQLGVQLTPTNWYRANQTKAFGVAQFRDDSGNLLAFIKYFRDVAVNPTQNAWDNQTGIPGYRYAGKAAAKTQAEATPQDILTQLDDLTPAAILAQVSEKFPNSSLVTVTEHLVNGGALPFTFSAPAEMDLATFQDYFCELLQPIALQTGQYDGEADKVEQTFLGDGGFAACTINFGKTKTEGLSDSIMIGPDGKLVKVSTKGGNGAAASSKNILDAYKDLQQTKQGLKILKTVDDTIELINTIVQSGQANAPLVLGIRYNIINEDDAEFIRSLKKFRPIPIESLKDISVFGKDASKKLIKLANSRETKNPQAVDFYHHLIAAIAHRVAEHVNEHTSFKKDAALILNHSALVQVYSKVTFQGKQWTLQKFGSKWPGSAVSEIALDAGKNYMSTQIKGNFTFVVDPPKKGTKDSGSAVSTSKVKLKDPGASMSADKVTRPGRKAVSRDKDTTPRQKRDK